MLATACGYTYPQIDEMTLPQVYELFAYWADCPPSHLLLRAYVGFKAPEKKTSNDFASFFSAVTGSLPPGMK